MMGDHTLRTSRPSSIGKQGPEDSDPLSPLSYNQLSSPTLDPGGTAYTAMYSSIESNGPYHVQEQNGFLNPTPIHTFQDTQYTSQKRNSIGSRPASLQLTNSNYSQFPNPFQSNEDQSYLIDPALQDHHQSINPADIMSDQEVSRHSRHGSLDPSVTLSHSSQRDWHPMGVSSFGHTRAPSEHSDISSVGPSPYLKQDGFEAFNNHSPMLHAQHDPHAFSNTLGLERFTISDQSQQGLSPRHSPFPSPRMTPLQPSIPGPSGDHFVLQSNDPYVNGPGTELYSPDMGQAPQIFISSVPTGLVESQAQENDRDALSPPARGRIRAVSDPMTRPLSPDARSPRFESTRQRSLSPFDQHFPGRESSPGIHKSRRSSTSSIPNRDYILDLADPNRTATAAGSPSIKVQKHPANFHCNLCTKRFTRAYNLRSHLRTHTDERPFVCTVCGKAFARQHDRKRHEGLHSGEKKFICKGDLSSGGNWGCGRRFARADALGRHFRSEAGRVCIKPLIDEDAAERHRLYEQQVMMNAQGLGMLPPALDINGGDGSGGNGGFVLPAALLAQYPALQGFQMSGPMEVEGDRSGRNSFDGGVQGEYYDDEGEGGGGYVSGPGTAYGTAWGGGGGPEWASDYEGR